MAGRQQLFPLLVSRWASFRTVRVRATIEQTTGSSSTSTRSTRKQLLVRSLGAQGNNTHRCFGSGSNHDDDDSRDVQQQKRAFLRALEGNKAKKKAREHKRFGPKRKQPGIPKDTNSGTNHPRSNNPKASTRKLTLDEFFANLEKPTTTTTTTGRDRAPRRTKRTNPNDGQKTQRREQKNPRPTNDTSSSLSSLSSSSSMGSFFKTVDALLEGKQNHPPPSPAPVLTTDLPPTFRSSIADILPQEEGGDDISYDVEAWDSYKELIDEIVEGPKFLARLRKKKNKSSGDDLDEEERTRQATQIVAWLRSGTPAIETRLPTLDSTLRGDPIENNDKSNTIGRNTNRSHSLRAELVAQKERFLRETGWKKAQYDVAIGALVALGGLCAKRCMASPLDVAWSKLKELGYPMNNKDVLHNYLYVASTFSLPKRKRLSNNNVGLFGSERIGDPSDTNNEQSSPPSIVDFLNGTNNSVSSSNGSDDDDDSIDVAAEVALCSDFFHEATEQSTGIHVRRLVQLGKANEAERLLDETMKSDGLRLRTYAPVYQTYLDQGDVSSAFKLFVKMKGGEAVLLQPETYVQLIACIAENGYFRLDAKEIDGIEDLPYDAKCGPELFNLLASELADHSIEITSASAKRLYNAFQRGFQGDDPKMNLKQLHLLESLRTNNDPAEPDELIASRVRIDATTGKCARSGAQLRLINLDPAQKEKFREGLLYLVSSSYQERHLVGRRVDVAAKMKKFGDWLQHGDGKSFTAIIDGPNVAYYMQNFQQGTFNYHQINFVVEALENMGERVLVVLPKKYTYDTFTTQVAGRSAKQTLSPAERDIRDDLLNGGKVCTVPVGSLDDYFWMFASVSMNEEFVPPDNSEGRWPGNRPMLISNDKLRDHKMSLLEPRLFRRWYSNFLVNFTFSAFVNDECVDREIGFRTADFYSREIQGNSDENGIIWHFPVGDWDENESLCLRIPQKKS